jgi:hypothetical protein
MAFSPNLFVAQKMLSWQYKLYVYSKVPLAPQH